LIHGARMDRASRSRGTGVPPVTAAWVEAIDLPVGVASPLVV